MLAGIDVEEPADTSAELGGLPGRAEDIGPFQIGVPEVGPVELRVPARSRARE